MLMANLNIKSDMYMYLFVYLNYWIQKAGAWDTFDVALMEC